MNFARIATALLLASCLAGCSVIGATAKITGTAVSTVIKTTGAIVAAPFKMMGGDDSDSDSDE